MRTTDYEYLDHDGWVEKFQPHLDEYGAPKAYDTHEHWGIIQNTPHNLVWTRVDGDMSDLIIQGVAWVNRLEYYICAIPWSEDEDEAVLLSSEEECKCYKPEGYPPIIGDINEDGDPNCPDCEGYGLITKYYEKEA